MPTLTPQDMLWYSNGWVGSYFDIQMNILWYSNNSTPAHRVLTYESIFIRIYVYMYLRIYVYMYIFIYVFMYLYICLYICLCIYIYKYACLYIWMFVCVGGIPNHSTPGQHMSVCSHIIIFQLLLYYAIHSIILYAIHYCMWYSMFFYNQTR